MSVVAVLEPTGGVQPRPASSTCQNESASQSKTISGMQHSAPERFRFWNAQPRQPNISKFWFVAA